MPKITDLPATSAVDDDAEVPISQGGVTVKATVAQMRGTTSSGVDSVNGMTGAVNLAAGDVGATPDPDDVSPTSGLTGAETLAVLQDGAMVQATTQQIADIAAAAAATQCIAIACGDETTALTTGAAKVTFRMPYAFTLSAVRASVTTAPTGAVLTVDINEAGASILSTPLTIDAGEKTSTTAATPAVISDTALADDAEITIDIDQVGSTDAGAGLKVYLIGAAA